MRKHETPRQVRPVLDLAEDHLDDEQAEQREPEPEQARRALAPRGEVAEHEDEADAEDRNRAGVNEDHRLEPPKPRHVLRAAARVRPGRGGQRPCHQQRQRSTSDEQAEPPQLQRHDRFRAPACGRERLQREHDRARKHDRREQQVRSNHRPAQVGLDREVAERRLRERPGEHGPGEPPRAA